MRSLKTCSPARGYATAAAAVVLSVGTLLSQATLAGNDKLKHLAQCKSALYALYGEETRLRMTRARNHRGIHTMKFKVYPEDGAMTVVECVSDETADKGIVVMTPEGDVLTP